MTDVIILSSFFLLLVTGVVLLKRHSDKVRKQMLDEMDELDD
jgi:hypothetical protein